MKKSLHNRIEETLQPQDFIKPVEPQSFLDTRILARMTRQHETPTLALLPRALKVAFAALLVLNGYYIYSLQKPDDAAADLASGYSIPTSFYPLDYGK